MIKEVRTSGGDGMEQWTSYDGGQGTATKLQHLEVTRTYSPETNMYGGKVLYGWIDADLCEPCRAGRLARRRERAAPR